MALLNRFSLRSTARADARGARLGGSGFGGSAPGKVGDHQAMWGTLMKREEETEETPLSFPSEGFLGSSSLSPDEVVRFFEFLHFSPRRNPSMRQFCPGQRSTRRPGGPRPRQRPRRPTRPHRSRPRSHLGGLGGGASSKKHVERG